MSGKSAGQQAYEAYSHAEVSMLAPRAQVLALTGRGWEALADITREWWEATAAAVETEQVRLARQDRDQLRKNVLDLAAELENSAAITAPSAKSRAENGAAARLRKIAEPPS